ncbi:hypothetical protein F4777DRAFT_153419 [Nemania sp. FL0916]|nr:hypothetical protein F4777DRAFT_153419 [Nemania sp. FL0916]
MGLLTFLSKKSYSDLTEHDSLKTSAYDATVASSPPIRGTYPVLGNGSKILEQFQKSHPNLAAVSQQNTPASSPRIRPRYNDSLTSLGVERPRTAPSNQPFKTASTSSLQSRSKSGLPPPPKKKYGPYKLPPKVMTDQVPSLAVKPAPSPGLVSIYSDSIRSDESAKTRGYVDLLDAHSMIKPSDFYGRIQATGAKNYGEDVADRNREDKSSSISIAKPEEPLSNHEDPKWTSAVTKHVDDDSPDDFARRPTIRHSVSSGLRSKHSSSSAFPKRTSSRLPPREADDAETSKAVTRTGSARSERAARRKSMPSFSASATAETQRSSSTTRRGKEKDADNFPDSLRDRALAVTAHERESTKPNISTKRQSLVSSQADQQARQKHNDLDKPLPALPPSKDQSRRKTVSHHSPLVESRLLVKRQSLQGIHSGSRGEIYGDTYQRKKSLKGTPRDRSSSRRQLGSTTDLQASFYNSLARQPDHKSHIISSPAKHMDNKQEPSQLNQLRKQSVASLSSTGIRPYEIETSIPERTSSLRHWSLTSETAMSTLSSNPFRPQSGHTTSTSVDFSPMFPLAHSDRSIPPVPDIPFLKPLQSTSRSTSAVPSPLQSPAMTHEPQSNEFYLEDHASSHDSSTTPSRGSYERDLLFSETDYGVSGTQISGLPGLFDPPISALSADSPTNRVTEEDIHSLPALLRTTAYHEPDSDHTFENHRGQIDSSDDEMNFDIPMSRAGSAMQYFDAKEWISDRRQSATEDEDSDY